MAEFGISAGPIFVAIISFPVFLHLACKCSSRLGLMDYPDHRKLHAKPVPVVGGISIYCATLVGAILAGEANILLGCALSFSFLVIGLIDDVAKLSVRIRFLMQIPAALIMISAGTHISNFGLFKLDGHLTVIAVSLSVICVVGLANAFNLVDGIDGLAIGQILVALFLISCAAMFGGAGWGSLSGLLVFIGPAIFFYLVNMSVLPFEKVFLGDSGSLFIGSFIGWILISCSQLPLNVIKPTDVLWCVTIPVFDTLAVMSARYWRGSGLFTADRSHLHHKLIDLGFSQHAVSLLLCGLSAGIGYLGLYTGQVMGERWSLALYCGCFLVYLVMFFGNEKKQ